MLGTAINTIFRSLFDSRIPMHHKIFPILSILYAFSPIDLISDVILLVGLLDDGLILTVGFVIFRVLLPNEIFEDNKSKALDDSTASLEYIILGFLVIWMIIIGLIIWLLL